uniref:Uncharacterized protein n=1 Tax=Arundo donax TaxID=35708 RepID=A0A0A9BK71_ARUDO
MSSRCLVRVADLVPQLLTATDYAPCKVLPTYRKILFVCLLFFR